MWTTRHDTDTASKQRDLDQLKQDRARDLSRLQGIFFLSFSFNSIPLSFFSFFIFFKTHFTYHLLSELTERYAEYESVVMGDKERKAKQRAAAEQAIKELAGAIRIQAWWRGIMVRHKLGPFKVKKSAKKSGKKGKKGKKK